MDFKLETWAPVHVERSVNIDELDDVYRSTSGGASPTFTWNDLGDQVLVVAVGDGYSVVAMLNGGTWHYLKGSDVDGEAESDVDGEAEIAIAGQSAHVPKGAILRRESGLEVLKKAGDFTYLLKVYEWMEQ
jgi:hypothetical protein